MTSRFTVAVHMLGLIAWSERHRGEPATSEQMARSVNTNPVVVRRLMGDLRRAGLVETKRGAGGGVRLLRAPERITLRDAYEAVEHGEALFAPHPNPPNASCPIGAHIEGYLHEVFGDAEEALKRKLGAITVAEMYGEIAARARRCGGAGRTEDEGERRG